MPASPPTAIDTAVETPTILLVAESLSVRTRIAPICQSLGFAVVDPSTPMDALRQYRSVRPQVTLLDGATLPQHGVPVIRQLRALDPSARIVLLNVRATLSLVSAAVRAGAADVLGAPIEETRLVQAICALVTPPTERRHVRVPLHVPARITAGPSPGAALSGTIEDLSRGGLRCRLSAPADALDVGAVAHVRFVLPDGRGLLLTVGRVVRLPTPDTLALAFVSLSEAHADRIEEYCRHLLAAQPEAAHADPADRAASAGA